jgi:hypothetical protein
MKSATRVACMATLAAATTGMLGVTTTAFAGGNGNGGNGSGGAHGAATSGMTYHSEPVSSPWNRPYGDALKTSRQPDADSTAVTQGSQEQYSKILQ